jgi:enamine deaminase RidA (YjgF/YER057c/UK114 family)
MVQIVRVGVFVQSDQGFGGQPQVANGASDLLVSVFGDAGRHAHAAIGVNALPLNASVVVELTVRIL